MREREVRMTNYKRWLFAALLLAAAPLALRADDTEAVELYREGRAAYDEQPYHHYDNRV